jgi:hypothetical protein
MRRFAVLCASAAAVIVASLVLPTSPASADGGGVVNLGPGDYTIGFANPSGTTSTNQGAINARCATSSVTGSAANFTPRCVTRAIKCPATAPSCTLIADVHESASRGPVAVHGQVLFVGGFPTGSSDAQPYNCPGASNCGVRTIFTGIPPGTTMQVSAFNILYAPLFPSLIGQLSLLVD